MKQATCKSFLYGAGALGVLRLADLFFFTDVQTGFVTFGSAWLRYSVLAIFVLAVLLYGRVAACAQQTQPRPATVLPGTLVLLALGALAFIVGGCYHLYAVEEMIAPTTAYAYATAGMQLMMLVLRMGAGFGLWALGVFCLRLARRRGKMTATPGVLRIAGCLACVGTFCIAILRYAEVPASVHRLLQILPVLSALAGLQFLLKLVALCCRAHTPQVIGAVIPTGICAFLLCACIELPQALWQLANGTATMLPLALAAVYGLLGVFGAIASLHCAKVLEDF